MKAKKNKCKNKVVSSLVIASIFTTGLATGATLLTTSPNQVMAATISEDMTIKEIFPDPNLAKVIVNNLNISVDSIVTQTQLDSIYSLVARASNIGNIEGMQYLTNLEYLDIDNNIIKNNLTPLSKLTNLKKIDLSDNRISDVSSLSKLTNLNAIELNDNQISDLSPLSNLTNLTSLYVGDNKISDLSPLSNLNLRTFMAQGNQISDLTPLSDKPGLRYLYLDYNQISDLSVLPDFTQIINFSVYGQTITLPDVNVGESADFILNNYDGSVPAITYKSGTGTYSNNQLTWNTEGEGQLTWRALINGNQSSMFSGTVNQKVNAPKFANHIFWVTRPGDDVDLTSESSVEVPVDYIDRIGRKEIDLMFYGEKNQLLDMNNYEINYSNNGVLGDTVTPTTWKTKGHANLPILGTGKTTMTLKDKTTGAVQKIVEVVVTDKGL